MCQMSKKKLVDSINLSLVTFIASLTEAISVLAFSDNTEKSLSCRFYTAKAPHPISSK